MILLKNVELYTPRPLGLKDVLVAGEQIVAIQERIDPGTLLPEVQVIQGQGRWLLPGFIDTHLHLTGGGGEGGPHTRTPEIMLSDLTMAGVTTVVGCLGTDGFTRTMGNLLAKAQALTHEGITAFAWTGSYQVPPRTLMDSIEEDLLYLAPVIGVGEIALADHRSSQPSLEALKKLTASARVGGMLSGKAGVVNIHLGDTPGGLEMLQQVARDAAIPLSQFLPTHQNRSEQVFEEALTYGKSGGWMDFTTSTVPQFLEAGEVAAHEALAKALDAGIPIERLSFSSDAQGSLPAFDHQGNLTGLAVGKASSLLQSVQDAVTAAGVSFPTALQAITSTPASHLKLAGKGRIGVGMAADLVLVEPGSLLVDTVIARGQVMVAEGKPVKRGTFED
ncbi:beta-aspartyl-peptidase [Anoxynatronum sibiricum]|uniref:Isoaspartyl dipeptidase n=1 Tax=Anoxynatronum sibiricum TaxID=210623 RepID=A0ABU9VPR4_9CLOT